MHRNVSDWERVASIVGGGALMAYAWRQRRADGLPPVAATAASALLVRGVTGYCPMNAVLGRNTRSTDTRKALGGAGGIHVRERITIARPPEEVYGYWRNLSNLPAFMSHLESVEVLDGGRSRWTARGPAGSSVSWEAVIINEIPGELIGWRSLAPADVVSAGSVQFVPVSSGRATDVRVRLQYEPPAGRLGSLVAALFGEEPSQQIREDLGCLKAYLETVPGAERRHARRAAFPAHSSRRGKVRPFRD